MGRRSRYPQELRERAVRMVQEHRDEYPSEWAAMTSIAGKLGVGTEALRLWLRRAQMDEGQRPGLSSQERERLKQLEHQKLRATYLEVTKRAYEALDKAKKPPIEPHIGVWVRPPVSGGNKRTYSSDRDTAALLALSLAYAGGGAGSEFAINEFGAPGQPGRQP